MYRIYDDKRECWRDDMLIMPDGAFAEYRKTMFGNYKMIPKFDESHYILHYDIGIYDKNHSPIFEGDICRNEKNETYIVAYSNQTLSYCLFGRENDVYYILSEDVGKEIEIVGNVIDGVMVEDADS